LSYSTQFASLWELERRLQEEVQLHELTCCLNDGTDEPAASLLQPTTTKIHKLKVQPASFASGKPLIAAAQALLQSLQRQLGDEQVIQDALLKELASNSNVV